MKNYNFNGLYIGDLNLNTFMKYSTKAMLDGNNTNMKTVLYKGNKNIDVYRYKFKIIGDASDSTYILKSYQKTENNILELIKEIENIFGDIDDISEIDIRYEDFNTAYNTLNIIEGPIHSGIIVNTKEQLYSFNNVLIPYKYSLMYHDDSRKKHINPIFEIRRHSDNSFVNIEDLVEDSLYYIVDKRKEIDSIIASSLSISKQENKYFLKSNIFSGEIYLNEEAKYSLEDNYGNPISYYYKDISTTDMFKKLNSAISENRNIQNEKMINDKIAFTFIPGVSGIVKISDSYQLVKNELFKISKSYSSMTYTEAMAANELNNNKDLIETEEVYSNLIYKASNEINDIDYINKTIYIKNLNSIPVYKAFSYADKFYIYGENFSLESASSSVSLQDSFIHRTDHILVLNIFGKGKKEYAVKYEDVNSILYKYIEINSNKYYISYVYDKNGTIASLYLISDNSIGFDSWSSQYNFTTVSSDFNIVVDGKVLSADVSSTKVGRRQYSLKDKYSLDDSSVLRGVIIPNVSENTKTYINLSHKASSLHSTYGMIVIYGEIIESESTKNFDIMNAKMVKPDVVELKECHEKIYCISTINSFKFETFDPPMLDKEKMNYIKEYIIQGNFKIQPDFNYSRNIYKQDKFNQDNIIKITETISYVNPINTSTNPFNSSILLDYGFSIKDGSYVGPYTISRNNSYIVSSASRNTPAFRFGDLINNILKISMYVEDEREIVNSKSEYSIRKRIQDNAFNDFDKSFMYITNNLDYSNIFNLTNLISKTSKVLDENDLLKTYSVSKAISDLTTEYLSEIKSNSSIEIKDVIVDYENINSSIMMEKRNNSYKSQISNTTYISNTVLEKYNDMFGYKYINSFQRLLGFDSEYSILQINKREKMNRIAELMHNSNIEHINDNISIYSSETEFDSKKIPYYNFYISTIFNIMNKKYSLINILNSYKYFSISEKNYSYSPILEEELVSEKRLCTSKSGINDLLDSYYKEGYNPSD